MEQNTVLRNALRGYHKMQTVMLINNLNILIKLVEIGEKSQEDAAQEAETLMRKPLQKVFGGFRTDDVDAFLASLLAKLKGETH